MTKPMGALPGAPYLATLRTRLRKAEYGRRFPEWNRGGCAVVSEVIRVRYRVPENGGCYVSDPYGMEGEPGTHHIAHCWNDLPDGRILDVTADQFGDEDLVHGVRVTSGDDPRYLPECPGDTCDPS